MENKESEIFIPGPAGRLEAKYFKSNKKTSPIALILTHLHSDHVIDLYQLIISSWHSYRTKPWKIYGPKGTKKFVSKIMKAWQEERTQRIKYENRSSTKAFDIIVKEFSTSGTINIKDLRIKYFEVDHKPVPFAYGFCFLKDNY